MNKNTAGFIIALLIVGGASYYAGTKYGGKSTRVSPANGSRTGNFQGDARVRNGGGFVVGQIVSNDGKSMVLKLQDGSSKIILLGSSAAIMKTATGVASDLTVGKDVTVTGTANSDGSVTAQSIQIRPEGTTGGFGSRRGETQNPPSNIRLPINN